MASAFSAFFETDSYFIDEKVNLFKFQNEYKVYNELGVQIGAILQRLTPGQIFLRLLLNKAMLPFRLEIVDAEGVLQASLSRGWTFWMSKVAIFNGQNEPIGFIQQKFKFFKPTFHIFDTAENLVATISGDWIAWNFQILDPSEQAIGSISKKWAGVAKELFTSADKYLVRIDPGVKEDDRKIAIVATAITVDMIFKEKK